MLRKLERKDAPLMLEWMHDADVVKYMGRNFKNMELSDCEDFIKKSDEMITEDRELMTGSLHLAIEDSNGEYMGTVSIKNIDRNVSAGEFAIVIRKCAMGKGISEEAMKEIISIGHEGLSLQIIYWCVSVNNHRAIRFYETNNYKTVELEELKNEGIKIDYSEEQLMNYIWFRA